MGYKHLKNLMHYLKFKDIVVYATDDDVWWCFGIVYSIVNLHSKSVSFFKVFKGIFWLPNHLLGLKIQDEAPDGFLNLTV